MLNRLLQSNQHHIIILKIRPKRCLLKAVSLVHSIKYSFISKINEWHTASCTLFSDYAGQNIQHYRQEQLPVCTWIQGSASI